MVSVFTDKNITPTQSDLDLALGDNYVHWKTIQEYAKTLYDNAFVEWNYSGIKYGWSFRIKDKKRVIVYLLPRNKFFKVALVFGEKAYKEILEAPINEFIKNELKNAKPYAEGRGIRIEIKDDSMLTDIKKLIEIKIKY